MRAFMNVLGQIGAGTRARLGGGAHMAAMVWAVAAKAARPGTWTAPLRNVLARQILFTGLEATSFVSLIALIVGVLVVVQAQYWLTRLGQTALIGPILTAERIEDPARPMNSNAVSTGASSRYRPRPSIALTWLLAP